MSEAGQPGAATPGEHGDGTGQRDDLGRSVSGWPPSAPDWSWGGDDAAATWRHPGPPSGWATAAPRHADLPAPFGEPTGPEQPARLNGHHINGVRHSEEPSGGGQHSPVSAPPGPRDSGHDPGRDRLVLPAPRPGPPAEQPAAGSTGLPTSAPPAVQVPPVGTAASGFEMPPGLHAPTAERSGDAPVGGPPSEWDDAFPPEPAPEARPELPGSGRSVAPPAADRPPAPGPDAGGQPPVEPPSAEPERPSWARSGTANDWAPSWARGDAPSWPRGDDEPTGRRSREVPAQGWTSEPNRPYEPVRAEPTRPYEAVPVERPRPYEPSRSEAQPGPGREPAVEPEPAERPAWATEPHRAPPGPERPSWAARSTSGPPAGEHPSWGTPPVSGVPADETLPWGARPDEPPSWASRAGGQSPGEERLPWALGPASAPPATSAKAAAASAPPAGVSPFAREAPLASAPPASAPPFAREAPPEPGSALPVAEAGAASDLPTYRPYRLRSVPDEPAASQPAPEPAVPNPTSASTDPADGASTGGGTGRRERTPTAPVPTSAAPYAARRSAPDPELPGEQSPDGTLAVLPQRVPAEPDVPVVPEPPAVDPPAETPELARIATHLRREDESAPLRDRPEGFDVNAILDAVRGVEGVRDASLRRTPAGAHSLRLDLADGADPAEVSRQVARLLQERMGLAAAPQGMPGTPVAPVRRRSAEKRGGDAGEAKPTSESRRPVNRPAGTRAEAVAARTEQVPETPRRRRPATSRGRGTTEETAPPGSPATLGASYSGGQLTTTESAPSRPLNTGGSPGPRVVLDHVQVSTFGLDATVEIRLIAGEQNAAGYATGPAVDGYVLRLCAVAAAAAIDELLRGTGVTADQGRCFVEHAAVVPFGNCEVATVVVLLVCDGWVEQLAGSALVAGDPRQAVVRATLAAVNRRLEALLA
ncbi:hypothetical protein Vqi01_14600 [Micromonospora qiuiae]|uniref:Uncharacterized protein n=1 Tax=Micromonospora qiuiae TaxID=502268 RepID=A0ABQ4J891_9ACTN|nr:hypothetical protein [Micromonospora qiuiae]GIJ26298.1 hypothetical protein Vqi01_14600 [Micromonospora qiuiae]